MLLKKELIYSASAIFFGLCNPAQAGSITIEVMETMMEAQSYDNIFLSFMFGPDIDSTLNYTTNIDTAGRTFSYTSVVNETYLGMGFSLSSLGAYSNVTNEYGWTSTGALGSDTWTTDGTMKWVGDPVGTGSTTVTIGGKTYTIEYTVEYSGATLNLSNGTYKITGPPPGGGVDTTWTATGRDRVVPGGDFRHTITVPMHPLVPTGEITFLALGNTPRPDGGIGQFTTSQTVVPLSPSIAFTLMGFGILGAIRRLKYRRS